MSTATRQTVRTALGTLLSTISAAQVVYAYPKATFDGQSPVISLSSGSSDRQAYTYGASLPKFRINLHVFVLYSDPSAGWTESDAENLLDSLENSIDGVLNANQEATHWQNIQYAGATTINNLLIGGATYRHELIPLLVEVYEDSV